MQEPAQVVTQGLSTTAVIAIWTTAITAISGLGVALINNRRLRAISVDKKEIAQSSDATKLRLREIDAVEELRNALRDQVKDQGEEIERHKDRIRVLETELENARVSRLEHERERLLWNEEREDLRAQIRDLRETLDLLKVGAGIRKSSTRTRKNDLPEEDTG